MVAGKKLSEGETGCMDVGDSVEFLEDDELRTSCLLRLLWLPETSLAATPHEPLKKELFSQPPFTLSLAGTALRAECPEDQRQLVGKMSGVTLGRQHQPGFLSNAISKQALGFVSREHFTIKPQNDSYQLLALSQHPLWVSRGGQQQLCKTDVEVPLEDGDAVMLYTGEPELSPGTLYITYQSGKGMSTIRETSTVSDDVLL